MTAGIKPSMLTGAPAFRDLGGMITLSGRRVRKGLLYRSEALLNLDAEDQTMLASLGMRVVCDLRSDHERVAHPCTVWGDPGPRMLTFDLSALTAPATARAMERLRADPGPGAALEIMMGTYEVLPQAAVAALRTMVAALIAGESPLLVHCSAGKDRTGFVSAMLLEALGVSRDHIEKDYLRADPQMLIVHAARTQQIMKLLLQQPLDAESLTIMSQLRPAYLAASYQAIERQWGSVDRYLDEAIGLNPEARKAFQAALLEK